MKLSDYDTIILDLDYTVWDGCEPKYWAKYLNNNLRLEDRKIIDSTGKYVEFHENIKEVLLYLNSLNKNIGFITLGGLLDTEYDDQIVVKCLKLYNIYDLFNHQKTVLYRTGVKSKHILPINKTIFIDDSEENLLDMKLNVPHVDIKNRYSFNNWNELL